MLRILRILIVIVFALTIFKQSLFHGFAWQIGMLCIVIALPVSFIENRRFVKGIERNAMSKYILIPKNKWWQFWR
jgi:hypothetical protein